MLQRLISSAVSRLVFYLVLVILLQSYSLLPKAFAENNGPVDEPKIWLSTGVSIESESQEPESQKNKSWLGRNKWWVALGAIVLGGTVAGVSASGDDGGDGSDSSEKVGDYNVEW